MECLKYFADGYRSISDNAKEDNDSYENVKQDLDDVLTWKKLEEKTRDKIIEIKDYFQDCLRNSEENDEEAVIKKAKEFGEVMEEYSKKIYKIDASISLEPQKIDVRISLLKERIERIEVHGLRFGIACIALLSGLGAVTAWQIYGAKAVKIVLGGAVGLGCGILMFLTVYHSILALERRHLSKWEELKKPVKDFPEMVEDIKQKRKITRDIATLLTVGVEMGIIDASQEIVNQCEEFLAN